MPIESAKAKVHCSVFKDNKGAIEIARIPKYRPQNKAPELQITPLPIVCGHNEGNINSQD